MRKVKSRIILLEQADHWHLSTHFFGGRLREMDLAQAALKLLSFFLKTPAHSTESEENSRIRISPLSTVRNRAVSGAVGARYHRARLASGMCAIID